MVLFHRASPFEHSEWDLLTTVRKKKKVLMFFNAARPAKPSQLRKMDSLPSCSSSIELFKMAMKKMPSWYRSLHVEVARPELC